MMAISRRPSPVAGDVALGRSQGGRGVAKRYAAPDRVVAAIDELAPMSLSNDEDPCPLFSAPIKALD